MESDDFCAFICSWVSAELAEPLLVFGKGWLSFFGLTQAQGR